MTEIRHIVFDIGRVLIHYDPEIPFRRIIPDDKKRQWFFETVCTSDWNVEQDRGRKIEDAEALLIADYPDEETAWAYVRPRALALREQGRVEDLYRVDHAQMLLTVDADVVDRPAPVLTTVQNDWRHPGGDAREWLAAVDAPADVWHSRQLFTTDPHGAGGPGRHLAFFESDRPLAEVASAWSAVGAAGSSPVPPYTTLYGVTDERDRGDEPDPRPAWVMHWEHLVTVGR